MKCYPCCGVPVEIQFNIHLQKDAAYCHNCSWDEEDGGNYIHIDMESI